MTATTSTLENSETLFVLGEVLRPLLTNASGPAAAGPPPHKHPWEEIYVVLSGELEVTVSGESTLLKAGGVVHVPAGAAHAYRNVSEAHFLTIVSKGNAARFFKQVSSEVEMNPPDLPGVLRVAAVHAIEFLR
jgi:quercetin dioxygenase-like cupin family protein